MKISLKTLKVQGDGHCLYRAIMQSFADGYLTKTQEKTAATRFREAVTRYICTHPSKFKRMFHEEKRADDYLAQYDTFEDYCVAARRPGSRLYGGMLDLQAAADILHATVMVHWPKNETSPQEDPILSFKSRSSSSRQNAPTIIRIQKTTHDHYDAIVYKRGPPSGPPPRVTKAKASKKKKKKKMKSGT
jgi:hypothetical protein